MTTTNDDTKRNKDHTIRKILLILVFTILWVASVVSTFILGNRSGVQAGVKTGYGEGYSAGHSEGASAGYRTGYSAGSCAEAAKSYQSGYKKGRTDGFKDYQESVQNITITQNTDAKVVRSLLGMPDAVVPGNPQAYKAESCWVYGDVKIYLIPGYYAGELWVHRWEGDLQGLIQQRVTRINAQAPQD